LKAWSRALPPNQVAAYKDGGEPAARSYVEDLESTQHVHAYIFGPSGKEISGGWFFPGLKIWRRTGRVRHHSWLDSFLPERFYRQSQSIADRTTRWFWNFRRAHGYSVLMAFPALGLTIAVISSGLVCYLLAWSLTSPVVRLRQAAQRLAAGDLTARTGAPMKGRRDELAPADARFLIAWQSALKPSWTSQSRLLKDVSHELRSPLARLSVALGLARRQAAPEAEAALNRIELEGRPA